MKRLFTILLLATLSSIYVVSDAQFINLQSKVTPSRKFWDDGTAKACTPHPLHGDIEEIEITTTRKLPDWTERQVHTSYFKFNEHGDVTSWIDHNKNGVEDFRLEAKYDAQGRLLSEKMFDYGKLRKSYTYTYDGNTVTERTMDEQVNVYTIESFIDPEDGSNNIIYYCNGNEEQHYRCVTRYDGKTKYVYEIIASDLNEFVRCFEFDKHNNITLYAEIYPGGHYYGFAKEYNRKGRVTIYRNYRQETLKSTTKYSYKGNCVVQKTYDADNELTYHAISKYDKHGNVIEFKEVVDKSPQAQMEHSIYVIKYRE